MSDPSHSPQQDPLQSDAVSGGSPPPSEETPVQPESDAAAPEAAVPVSDPAEENSPGEEDEDDEEGEEIDDDNPAVSSMDLRPTADAAIASPTGRRGESKRRKGKGKGKRKPHAKKLQVIEEKLRNLRSNLNPIPFIDHKILHFAKHEKLFKKLGLWEFVHIDFDKTIRKDFIAQLVANYNPKLRSSSVNGCRVGVNRADLARSLKLPVKKEKGKAAAGGAGAEVDLDWEEVLSDDSLGFIAEFVSDWVLLHEDTWMMPNEVMDWMKMIKEGHPEKVDWAGMLWFMVEKELKQGGQLKDCYYACHLQQLIKCQQGEVFLMGEEPVNAEAELDSVAEVMVVKDEASDGTAKESEVVEIPAEEGGGDLAAEGPSTELTLGQDGEKEEEVNEVEMVDAEKCKESDEEAVVEERVEAENWFSNGKNSLDEHFMQRCSTENAGGFGSFEHMKDDVVKEEENEEDEMDGGEDGEEDGGDEEEEEEEEEPDNYHVLPFANGEDALEVDEYTGNYLQGNQMGFTQEQHSSVDINVHNNASAPSFYNNSGKRPMDHDYHNTTIDSNKRLRVNESWENTQDEFGMCMEQIQQAAHRARMLHEEKEQAMERANISHQALLDEVHKRDVVIAQLHKAKMEEAHKKDMEIWRLERELQLIGSVVHDYRKALKDVRKAFAEYRDRAQLSEESTYKDVGLGLMLTAAEIEKRQKIEEEEYRVKCFVIEQQMKEEENGYNAHMQGFFDKVNHMNQRLTGLEADAKQLIALYSKKRIPKTEEEDEQQQEDQEQGGDDEEMHEVAETLPVPEPDEPVDEEVTEAMPSTELEEQVAEAAEDPAIPQGDEKIVEAAEPPSVE